MAIIPSTSNTSAFSSSPSSAASMPRWRGHALGDLEADDRRELPLAEPGLDHRQEVVRVFLPDCSVFALRVTRNSSQVSISMPGNRRSRLSAITLSSVTKVSVDLDLEESRCAGAERHLHAREVRRDFAGVTQRDEQVQRQVRDEREGVRGVGRLRRHEGEDVLDVEDA